MLAPLRLLRLLRLPALLLVSIPPALHGQVVRDLVPGTRVQLRYHAPHARSAADEANRSGTLVALDATTLLVRDPITGDTTRIARRDLTRVLVSRGRRSPGAGFGRGFAHGAAVGLIAGIPLSLLASACDGGDGDPCGLGYLAHAGVAAGSALIGGLLGLAAPGERWQRLDLDAHGIDLRPLVGRGAGLAVRIAF